MFKILFFAFAFTLPLIAQEPASENTKTRPNKQEVVASMRSIGRMPAPQQNSKLGEIWQDLSVSKTPRSDFMFCVGMAYLGNYRAQRCIGDAYENGRGVVEDLSEAYAWYSVAVENKITDKADLEKIEGDRDRVQNRLLSAYPHPTEDELADLVSAQKSRIAQYQEDTKKSVK